MSNEEKTVQTDEELIYNYAWLSNLYFLITQLRTHKVNCVLLEFYHYFQQIASTDHKGVVHLNEKIDSINISPAANKETSFITEIKNGIYFDTQSGLYYDSVS